MKTLTDLEIVIKIAKIEDVFDKINEPLKRHNEYRSYWFLEKGFSGVTCPYEDQSFIDVYNPLTDKALLWDLMAKYKVEIDFDESFASTYEDGGGKLISYSSFDNEVDLPRAVLLAIIEAHGVKK